MTEPTAEEIREMAAWAGATTDPTCDGDSAWNDGPLLWAMHTKLREGGTAEVTYAAAGGGLLYGEGYTGQWYSGENDAERLWTACREVRK